MPAYEPCIYAQRETDFSHFVLEEHTQRFHYLQTHLFRQSAHIVMRFDYCCGAVHLGRFHNIRINGTLSEPFYISELMCFLLKYFHKVPAYDSAFCLRIGDSCKVGQEFIRSICNRHIQSHIAVGIHNIANLVLAQQSRVHEYAVQAFAYCLVQ